MPHDPFPTEILLDSVAASLSSVAKPMHDIVLVPCNYTIALSHEAYDELEPIQSVLRSQITRRLDDELARLNGAGNTGPWWRRMLQRLRRTAPPPRAYNRGGVAWDVRFTRHDDATQPRNQFLLYPSFASGEGPRPLEAAGQTVRLGALSAPEGGSSPEGGRTAVSPPTPTEAMAVGPPLAWIRYTDDEGDHELPFGSEYRSRSATIGRIADRTDWVEIPVAVQENVSRDHARLKYDEATARFLLLDKSLHGTAIDGRKVPSSYGEAEDHWVPLPNRADVSLADSIVLRFEQVEAQPAAPQDPYATTRQGSVSDHDPSS